LSAKNHFPLISNTNFAASWTLLSGAAGPLAPTYSVFVCICIYMCIYVYNEYKIVKSAFAGPQNKHLNYTMCSTTLHKTPARICCGGWVCPATAVEQKQPVDAARCRAFAKGLIGMFVIDFQQIPSGSIQMFSVCIAPPCTPGLRVCLTLISKKVYFKLLIGYEDKVTEKYKVSK
jgi:hypothetical protein